MDHTRVKANAKLFQKMVSEVVQVEFRVIFCLWQDVHIHVKPLHLSVSQKSVAMDQLLVSQYVSGTVDTIAGKSANIQFL